jgi:short subunit dehydrogenase-like uncharacterized protein
MSSGFLLYGSTGFVGDAVARLAVQRGLRPIIAGRNAAKVGAQATELGLQSRVFGMDDSPALDQALKEVAVVLHCAGPYIYTYRQMVEGCLRTGTHYLDITGEIPVYAALAARDAEAKARRVMLLPGVGFDVVPTDCLALYLKRRLPSATRLTLAFHSDGPAGLPPGTANTMMEMIPYGNKVRRNGRLETPMRGTKTRWMDLGQGPVQGTRLTWGDVFMAFYSTGIPNVEDYAVLPEAMRRQMASLDYLRPLFRFAAVRHWFRRQMKAGSTADERARTHTTVWGEVEDEQGRKAVARVHGPEAGVVWTSRTALAAVQKVLAGTCPPGFQTPSLAYGADFVLECEGVTRQDVN